MSDTPRSPRCTFKRDGAVCGRREDDATVHVREDEPMRHGAHVWRHETPSPSVIEDGLAALRGNTPAQEPLRELAEAVFTTGALRHRSPHPDDRQKCAACRIKALAYAALGVPK